MRARFEPGQPMRFNQIPTPPWHYAYQSSRHAIPGATLAHFTQRNTEHCAFQAVGKPLSPLCFLKTFIPN